MTTEHRHYYDVDYPAPENRCTEIGDGVCIQDGGQYGFFVAHDRPADDPVQGYRCEGRIPVTLTEDPAEEELHRQAGGGPRWLQAGTLEAGDLTLSPSIRCLLHDGKVPGGHGFVTRGKWVRA